MAMGVNVSSNVKKKIATTTQVTQDVYLDLVKKHGEIVVTSAHRSASHNAKVKGAKNSQHVHRRAIDLFTRNISKEKRNAILADLGRDPRVGGVGLYPSGNIHFDTRPRGKNGSVAIWGSNHRSNTAPAVLRRAVNGQTPIKIGQDTNVHGGEGPLGRRPSQTELPAGAEITNSAQQTITKTIPKPKPEWTQQEVELQAATGRTPTKTVRLTQQEVAANNINNNVAANNQQQIQRQRSRGSFINVPGVEGANSNVAAAVNSQLSQSARNRGNAASLFGRMHRNGATQGEISVT